jgi:hypothetical protein
LNQPSNQLLKHPLKQAVDAAFFAVFLADAFFKTPDAQETLP